LPSTYYVGWWNLENLFDEENSPRRTEKLQRAIGADLAGWTPARRDRKVSQLASVIAQMNGGAGPDLLGVCEVENRFVLDLLVATLGTPFPGRNYEIVQADTDDERGIDVAFLYDRDLFEVPDDQVFFHVVMRRNATRELVQVNFKTQRDRTWSVFRNHWPSRSGGQFESAGYRHIAGETLSYFHQRALEVHGAATPALAMGDFNDEPFDTSMVIHALSTRQRQRVLEADTPRFWNLTWSVIGDPADGTFYFNNEPNLLDQFLVNKNMAKQNVPIRAKPETVEILRFAGTFSTGKYPRPKPFGGMGKPVDEDGFSDHFPIGMQVIEAD
jgi:predicted extracellular nuclease